MMLLYNPVLDNFMVFTPVEISTTDINIPVLNSFDDLPAYTYVPTSSDSTTEDDNTGLPRMTNNPHQEAPKLLLETTSTLSQETTLLSTPKLNSAYLSFEDLIKLENLPIRINSGYRGPGGFRNGKTALGRTSNHSRRDEHGNPMAYDISPKAGYTWEDLRKIVYKNPTVVNWFRSRGWGVLEEMMDGKRGFYNVDGRFCYTGATGPHFHIGPDSAARKLYDVKVAKALRGMKFNFPFMEFVPVEEPKVEINMPLLDNPVDISDWASGVTLNGAVIVKPNLPRMTNNKSESLEMESSETQSTTSSTNNPSLSIHDTSATVKQSSGADALSKIIDEVSQESGFEGLKDPEVKKLIMLQALRESNFNPKVLSKVSTATGYFLFIDLSRQSFSKMSKDLFLNNPKEQVRAAYKLYKYIHSLPDSKKLLERGYNMAQVTALGWWYPRAMGMILNGKNNFSLGGYSIKQAINDYK